MNCKRFSALSLGLAALLAGRATESQAQKIGIVNVQAVLASIPAYVTADSQLKAEFVNYQREAQKTQATLDSSAAAFNQKALAMSATQKEAERQRLAKMYDAAQAADSVFRKKLQDRRDQTLGPIEDQVTKVIEGLRLTLGYSMILNYAIDPNPIVAVDKDLDVTQKVIDALKAQGKGGTAADPAKKSGGGGNP